MLGDKANEKKIVDQGAEVETSTPEQLRGAGELAAKHGAWVRLHYVYPYPHVDEVLPLMAAGRMTRDEMMAIAEWFSLQPWPNLNQPRASEADTKRSEQAIVAGQCGACHGAQGTGVWSVHAPALKGMMAEVQLAVLVRS